MKWRKKPQPTLVDELIELGEPAERLRSAAERYYENRPLLGAYLVDIGVVAPEKVAMALARQAEKRGDIRRAVEHLSSASSSLIAGVGAALKAAGQEAETIVRKIEGRGDD